MLIYLYTHVYIYIKHTGGTVQFRVQVPSARSRGRGLKFGSRCVAVCVLQYVAECCSVLQCIAEWCSVLQCVAVYCFRGWAPHFGAKCVLLWFVVYCGVLQCVAVCWFRGRGLNIGVSCVVVCVAVYCSVLQSVAECCFRGQGLKSEFRSGCRLAKRVLEDISQKSALCWLFCIAINLVASWLFENFNLWS